eukprot:GHVS01048173.1.p1 GENE.GHVS01048173.1~~GHVS01048173.1.p1  ORF type:complete len:557 (+),score=156.81 GHVS01048173.1:300-1970(+)
MAATDLPSCLPAVLLVTDGGGDELAEEQQQFVYSFVEQLKSSLSTVAQTGPSPVCQTDTDKQQQARLLETSCSSSCYCEFTPTDTSLLLSTVGSGGGVWSVRFVASCWITTRYYSANIAFWHCNYRHNNICTSVPYVALPEFPSTTSFSVTTTSSSSSSTSSTPSSSTVTSSSHSPTTSPPPFCPSAAIPSSHFLSAFFSPSCLIYLNCSSTSTTDLPPSVRQSPWHRGEISSSTTSFSSSRRCGICSSSLFASSDIEGKSVEAEGDQEQKTVNEEDGCCVSSDSIDINFAVVCTASGHDESGSIGKWLSADSRGHMSGNLQHELFHQRAQEWAADQLVETVAVRYYTDDSLNTPTGGRLRFVAVGGDDELTDDELTEEEDRKEFGRCREEDRKEFGRCREGVERVAEALQANLWPNALMAATRGMMSSEGMEGGLAVVDKREEGGKETSCTEEKGEEEHAEPKDSGCRTGDAPTASTVTTAAAPVGCGGGAVSPFVLDRFVEDMRHVREVGRHCSDEERRTLATETVMKIMEYLNIDEEDDLTCDSSVEDDALSD